MRKQHIKSAAHAVFDRLWQGKQSGTRDICYRWLEYRMGLKKEEAHFATMSNKEAKFAYSIIKSVDLVDIMVWYKKQRWW